ncbi:ATP synthase subunit f, mitochondrial-like [Heterodontus francisci]|uniref:ATP synthase subunit f, mitochondrial-like n=1 Tax=Heterodontus francisci TaxID=7792 RepID=UPI00355B6372
MSRLQQLLANQRAGSSSVPAVPLAPDPASDGGLVFRGHNRYYNKYINVKRGGIGGVAMLLAGYVLISYVWEYDHLKHERWRKYH